MATVAAIPLRHGEYFAVIDGWPRPIVALRVIDAPDGAQYHPVVLDDGEFVDFAPRKVEVIDKAKANKVAEDHMRKVRKAAAAGGIGPAYAYVQESKRTPGRWQVGDRELTSGDVIDFPFGGQTMRGRVEHDGSGYIVIAADLPAPLPIGAIRLARYIER